jgi:hypothetical protein
VPESTGPFILDRESGRIERLVDTYDGSPAPVDDVIAIPSAISRDGRVGLVGCGHQLVPGDTNGAVDVFVVDRDPDRPEPRFVTWGSCR